MTSFGPTSEEAQPNGDFFEQLNDAADASMPKLLKRLHDAVDSQGQKQVRIKCSGCGRQNSATVEIADIEETRKIVEMFGSLKLRAKAQSKDDTASSRARDILRDISELTSEQLAEHITALEAELEAESAEAS